MTKTFYIFILLTIVTHFAFAQAPKYSNEFLSIGVGARAHGMSGAMVASADDVTSVYWNPAGLTGIYFAEQKIPFQLGFMHAEWFAGIAGYDYIGLAKPLNESKSSILSLSLVRFGIDQIPNTLNLISPDGTINYDNVTEFSAADYAFFISYAQQLKNPKWSVGANTKIIRRIIGSFGTAWGFGLDVGVQYKTGDWRFGATGRDISSTYNAWKFNLTEEEKLVFQKTGNIIPVSSVEVTLPSLLLGVAYQKAFAEKYKLQAEIDFDFTFDGQRNTLISSKLASMNPHVGLEIVYDDFLFLRTGIGNIQKAKDDLDATKTITTIQPNFGVGILLGRVTIDYALTNIGNTSQVLYSNIFSILINLKKRKKVPAVKKY